MKKLSLLITALMLVGLGGLYAQNVAAPVKPAAQSTVAPEAQAKTVAPTPDPALAPSIRALGGPGKPAFAPKPDAVPAASDKASQPSTAPANKQDRPHQ